MEDFKAIYTKELHAMAYHSMQLFFYANSFYPITPFGNSFAPILNVTFLVPA